MRTTCCCCVAAGQGNVSLGKLFVYTTGEGNALLRDCFLRVLLVKATCCCASVLCIPPVKATCCCVTAFAFATGEGGVLLRDCLRVPPVRATCCVTVFRVPPVKATSCCVFSLRFPLMRIACYCVTVFAGTTGEGNISLRDCFLFSTGEGNALLRDYFCGYHR